MNTDKQGLYLNRITEIIIGCAFKVSNSLGCGFLEKVYENALTHELRKNGLKVEQQYKIEVWYDGIIIGEFSADLMIEDLIIIELKAIQNLEQKHIAQTLNYLKATKLNLGLLINFGTPKISIKRVINNN